MVKGKGREGDRGTERIDRSAMRSDTERGE